MYGDGREVYLLEVEERKCSASISNPQKLEKDGDENEESG